MVDSLYFRNKKAGLEPGYIIGIKRVLVSGDFTH